MKEKIKYLMSKKSFHIVALISIIAIILFVVGILILRYSVEGETNMPFNLTKIIVISSQEGEDKEQSENKWAFDLMQNNDIYLYVEKNKNYLKEEAIESIIIDNIKVEREKQIGTINFYRPNTLETGGNFSNKQENLVQTVEYKGAMESDIKNLKISNQGGIIAFRCANEKIGEYTSNDDEINHSGLLKKAEIKEEDLKGKIIFDLSISTASGKEYKTNITLDIPVAGIVENGTASKEITNLEDIVFKRTKN